MKQLLNTLKSLGRYKLIRELGRGGMSVVYLAQDTELEREVAIKCVDTSDNSTAKLAERLRSEAKLLAQLNQPNIVQLYDVVEQNNILGLVIEYVGGETLTQRLKQKPSKEVIAKWLAEIADGLYGAHTKGIAHCDLKADNILITHDNVAKIADFGIAKVKLDDYLEDDGLTRMDSVSGSYFSLSPEQATGKPVDTRTDLFSLAVLIYQSLTDEHPFGDTSNKVALLQRVISDPLTLSPRAQAVLGVRLTELVKNLLNKKPEERLYNAKEIAELLRSSQNAGAANTLEDSTAEIPVQVSNDALASAKKARTSIWISRLALITAGFLVGAGLLYVNQKLGTNTNNTNYIALDKIQIDTLPEFNTELLPLLESTLQDSAEQALLSLDKVALISSTEFQSIDGNYTTKAKATGASSIISLSAECDSSKCNLKLRKHTGEKMAVTSQRDWPVAVQYLTDIRRTLSDELSKLYPNSGYDESNARISENSYRAYLDVFLDSDNGQKSKPEHVQRLESIIEKEPFFTPAYNLARKVTEQLYRRTKNIAHLTRLDSILASAPKKLTNDPTLLDANISLNLLSGNFEKAEELFNVAKEVVTDTATLTGLEADIAYYRNQNDRLLVLDRKFATLRPSASTFYNLATSEYAIGDYEAAKKALDAALNLHPKHTLSLSLRATIAMAIGKLDKAIESYERAISENPSSSNLSNLGLAFMLNEEYPKAISRFKSALEMSPSNTNYLLNIADGYKLNGQEKPAEGYYRKVISKTKKPQNVSDFVHRAQAFAQIGDFINAIRTVNTAKTSFPNDANLKYATALVYALSNNQTAAMVAVEDALSLGTGPVWFNLPWFESLCEIQTFAKLTKHEAQPLCKS